MYIVQFNLKTNLDVRERAYFVMTNRKVLYMGGAKYTGHYDKAWVDGNYGGVYITNFKLELKK